MLLLLQLQAWIRKKEQTFVTKQNGTITKTGIVHSTRFYEQIRTKTENAKLWTHEDVGCRRVAKSFMAIPGRHHTERVAKSFTATPGRHQTGKVAKSIVEFLGRHQTERVAKGFTESPGRHQMGRIMHKTDQSMYFCMTCKQDLTKKKRNMLYIDNLILDCITLN